MSTIAEEKADVLLEANDIRFRYEASSPVILDTPTIRLLRGRAYSLRGGNMGGKTTPVKLLCGLLDSPNAEMFLQFDGDMFDMPKERSKLQLAGLRACHQNDPMFPELSIWENIKIGVPAHGFWRHETASEQYHLYFAATH